MSNTSQMAGDSQSDILNKTVRIPDAETIEHGLTPLFDTAPQASQHFVPGLVKVAGRELVYMGIIMHWELTAYTFLDKINQPVLKQLYAMGGGEYNISKEKFLCFCPDKEEGAAAWAAFKEESGDLAAR